MTMIENLEFIKTYREKEEALLNSGQHPNLIDRYRESINNRVLYDIQENKHKIRLYNGNNQVLSEQDYYKIVKKDSLWNKQIERNNI